MQCACEFINLLSTLIQTHSEYNICAIMLLFVGKYVNNGMRLRTINDKLKPENPMDFKMEKQRVRMNSFGPFQAIKQRIRFINSHIKRNFGIGDEAFISDVV